MWDGNATSWWSQRERRGTATPVPALGSTCSPVIRGTSPRTAPGARAGDGARGQDGSRLVADLPGRPAFASSVSPLAGASLRRTSQADRKGLSCLLSGPLPRVPGLGAAQAHPAKPETVARPRKGLGTDGPHNPGAPGEEPGRSQDSPLTVHDPSPPAVGGDTVPLPPAPAAMRTPAPARDHCEPDPSGSPSRCLRPPRTG